MSFSQYKEAIEENDTVILYLNIHSMHAIQVQPRIKNKKGDFVENVFQTTYGALKVSSLIGKKFGSKVQLSRGWAYVLHPTPELWTLTLPHRTQIIYTPDISMIILQLELKPGSVVVESGTGSGSLSHALIRSIKPEGHLHTFDFHSHRVEVARQEFESHGLSSYVTVEQRDVCQDGFGLDDVADAVFLDLPHPWEAVPHAAKVMKTTGGRFCSFSPCIEQVQRTCLALQESRFLEISTLEVVQREVQVQTRTMPLLQLPEKRRTEGGSSAEERKGQKDSGMTYSIDDKGREQVKFITGIPPFTMPGHTGYLTVATLPPKTMLSHPLRDSQMDS